MMKVKDLIEKLKTFDENLDVVGTYPYWDTTCGKDRWELTDDFDLYTTEVLKTKYSYSYEETYRCDKVVPYTKQTVLILDL
jgi:arabinogalactan endo-1,4-beta-galactosidase